MDSTIYSKPFFPVVTGVPQVGSEGAAKAGKPQQGAGSFQELLREKLTQKSDLNFSKHAVSRAVERGVDLSGSNLERLNEGVRIAGEKGLNDTLILVDHTAFIVSVKNNTVITTVSGEELKGNVFTNIQGTVII